MTPTNEAMTAYGEVLNEVSKRPEGWQAIDTSHALLVAGLVAAKKPEVTLELGIGSTYLTRVLLAALIGNQRGTLRSVDNFFDWGGNKPPHIKDLEREMSSWQVTVADESDFLRTALSSQFDMIISDGDHTRGYQNAPDIFRICKPGGIMIFHDTQSELFRLLGRLPARVHGLGYSSFHFTQESRSDEKTSRGLLVVSKDRRRKFSIDWPSRIYLMVREHMPSSIGRIFARL